MGVPGHSNLEVVAFRKRKQAQEGPVAQLFCWIFLNGWQRKEALKFLYIGQLTRG